MPRAAYTRGALDDIKEQFEYKSDYSDEVARRFADDLVTAISSITDFPAIGRERPELAPGLRSFAANRVRVVIYYYVLGEDDPTVSIARVLRQERDVDPEMFEGEED